MSGKSVYRKQTCVDDLPYDVKQIIIGAIVLCDRVLTFCEDSARRDVSNEQLLDMLYDAHVSTYELCDLLHKAFTWEDILKIWPPAGDEKEEKTDISIKKGETNG